jgi:YD repeat-containing protein
MSFGYDPKGYLSSVTDATKRTCSFSYAPNPSCGTQYTGDKRRLYGITCAAESGGALASVQYCYDADGNLGDAASNGRGEHYGYSSFTYTDPALEGLKDTNLESTLTLGGVLTKFTYYEGEDEVDVGLRDGNKVRARELVETISLPKIVNPDGQIFAPEVGILYNTSTRSITNLHGGPDKTYTLNQYGNPRKIEEARGKTSEFDWSVDSQSTAGGDNVLNRRAIKQSPTATIETTFGYDDQGRVTSETGPGARHVTQTWDRFGQLKTRTDSRGVSESWDYDTTTGFLKSYTDPKNTITTFTPDPVHLGLPLTLSIAGTNPAFVVTFAYDDHGNPKSATVTGSPALPRVTSYDERGFLLSETDPAGNTTTYGYQHDQVDSITLPPVEQTECGDAVNVTIQRKYDLDGNLEYEVDRNGVRLDYAYTGAGLVSKITRKLQFDGPEDASRTFNYYPSGNLRNESDWEGELTAYTYDELGLRTSVTNREDEVMTIVPDFVGNPLSITDFGQLLTGYTYDLLNRERTRTPVCPNDACGTLKTDYLETGGSVLDAWSVQITDEDNRITKTTYDANGNLVKRVNKEGKESALEYDVRNQLTKFTDEDRMVTSFEYDVLGRRKAIVRKGLDGSQTPLRVELDPDPNGNTRKVSRWRKPGDDSTREDEGTKFDAWNRPVERTFGSYKECLAYDGEGNLIVQQRQVDGKTLERNWHRDRLGIVSKYTDSELGAKHRKRQAGDQRRRAEHRVDAEAGRPGAVPG